MSDPLFDIVIYGLILILSALALITYVKTKLFIKDEEKKQLKLRDFLKTQELLFKMNRDKIMLADNFNETFPSRFFEIANNLILAQQMMFEKKYN